jgi:ribosomal protein S18 acetylase RimI-like enzyme
VDNGRPVIEVRRAVPGDEQALAQVGQATFLETFAGVLDGADLLAHCSRQHAHEVYRDWLADERITTWLATIAPGAAPVGYLVLAPPALPVADPGPTDVEIKRIYLLYRFQGAGVGRRLLDAAIRHARERGARRMLLGVYAHNHDALAFYARCGFHDVGERRFRVGDNEYDDRVLALDLVEQA